MIKEIAKEINCPTDKHKCTQCGACYNVCPSGAIEYIEDIDGFVYPTIQEEKCTNCGLCKKKCPALNEKATSEIVSKLENPICYGGYIDNEEIREKSSSGGMFSILADYILEKEGYICGARFTQGVSVEHVLINKKEDLAPLRGSKYVQSNTNDVYKKIKELLNQDKYVLFTGTPCQVAGLYQVLGKDYEKLITADLLCHGTPSQRLLKDYVEEVTNESIDNLKNINFRYKKNGWRKFWVNITTTTQEISRQFSTHQYCDAFDNNLTLRKSCSDCRFNRLHRQGDITIGDFWGVENNFKEIDDNKGLSAILINTNKAKKILKEIKTKFKILKEVPIDAIRNYNMVEWKSYANPYRDYFMERYSNKDYNSICALLEECLNKNDGVALLNYHYSKDNYGSVLTNFALHQKIKQMGYTPVSIRLYDSEKIHDMSNLGEFTRKYISETAPCWSKTDLEKLNENFRTFIVGPDAVWKDLGFLPDFHINLFNFVNFSKNICSYATSFANDKLLSFTGFDKKFETVSNKEIAKRKILYKRFSHISVREKSGIDLCKKHFDVEAKHVLDSVFFLNKEEWIEKCSLNKNKLSCNNTEISYILNHETIPKDCIELLNSKKIYKLYKGDNYINNFQKDASFKYSGVSIEEMLENIMNCDIFYTDSYHGMCFAIIFNRPFIVFNSSDIVGFERQKSLMNMLEIEDRTANSVEDIERLINTPIDWEKINKNLDKQLKISEDFLNEIFEEHNNPDKCRGYLESLELRLKELPLIESYKKEKFYFLGVQILKKKLRKQNWWWYFLGIPILKIIDCGDTVKYRLPFGTTLFKKVINR